MGIRYSLQEFSKKIAFRHIPWLTRPRYPYNLYPGQLAALIGAIDQTRHLSGSILEVGVARGMTTVFLNEHMRSYNDKRRYICVDTFSGFVPNDVKYEVSSRGKDDESLGGFSYNDPKVFQRNLEYSGFNNFAIFQKDCSLLTKDDLGDISVALLDVDLYLPTKNALPQIYAALQPGGIIMVDDVKPGTIWDGAAAAYFEFCKEIAVEPHVVANKGGMIVRQ